MLLTLRKVFSPLLALFIICMGSSLLTTLVALRMDDLGTGNFMVGLASSVFYIGMALGGFKTENFVSKFGHIRSYAVIASITAITSIGHIISKDPFVWLALRFFSGIAVAGIYVVVESWLLTYSNKENRGKILAIYMIALYTAQSLGQLFLTMGGAESLIPFVVVAIFANLSIIPLAFTTSRQPVYEQPAVLTLKKLFDISPSGFMATFIAGMILSVLYGLLPRAFELFNYNDLKISYLMATVIFGGMALQFPFGWFADRFDKRSIMMLICAFTAFVSLLLFVIVIGDSFLFYAILFLLGGLTFVISPIAMSHTCDYAKHDEILAVTGGLVLVYGLGCVAGPLIAPLFMHLFGPLGLYGYIAVSAAGLGLFMYYRSGVRPKLPLEAQQHVVVQNPHTTPVANELDPVITEMKGE